jgi:glucosamine 6-phosphate synthetase-like amidotransferase/phosphosugar isomerase protein
MCGIIGYVGKKAASPILLEGLRRLEYRGYDSAGVALLHEGSLLIRKKIGKIDAGIARLLKSEFRPTKIPIRIVTPPAKSPSSTTASSRTTTR